MPRAVLLIMGSDLWTVGPCRQSLSNIRADTTSATCALSPSGRSLRSCVLALIACIALSEGSLCMRYEIRDETSECESTLYTKYRSLKETTVRVRQYSKSHNIGGQSNEWRTQRALSSVVGIGRGWRRRGRRICGPVHIWWWEFLDDTRAAVPVLDNDVRLGVRVERNVH